MPTPMRKKPAITTNAPRYTCPIVTPVRNPVGSNVPATASGFPEDEQLDDPEARLEDHDEGELVAHRANRLRRERGDEATVEHQQEGQRRVGQPHPQHPGHVDGSHRQHRCDDGCDPQPDGRADEPPQRLGHAAECQVHDQDPRQQVVDVLDRDTHPDQGDREHGPEEQFGGVDRSGGASSHLGHGRCRRLPDDLGHPGDCSSGSARPSGTAAHVELLEFGKIRADDNTWPGVGRRESSGAGSRHRRTTYDWQAPPCSRQPPDSSSHSSIVPSERLVCS